MESKDVKYSQRRGVVTLVVIIMVMLAGGGGLYIYQQSADRLTENKTGQATTSPKLTPPSSSPPDNVSSTIQILPPSIQILSPNGNETFEVDKTYLISWEIKNLPPDAYIGKIALVRDAAPQEFLDVIPFLVGGSKRGPLEWKVPTSIISWNDYRVYLALYQGPPSSKKIIASDFSDAPFTIISPKAGTTSTTNTTPVPIQPPPAPPPPPVPEPTDDGLPAPTSANSLWTFSTGGTDASPMPILDTAFNQQGHSRSYITESSTIYSFDNLAPSNNKRLWTEQYESDTLSAPAVVKSFASEGTHNLYLVRNSGRLLRIDVTYNSELDTVNANNIWAADARRGSCSADQLIAPPTVQQYALSNAEFQQTMDAQGKSWNDLIYVTTYHLCGDSTKNQIIAYGSNDATVVWRFNAAAEYAMDYGVESCALDYTNNMLYCGTNLPANSNQNTLWAISTLDGSLSWSMSAGSIRTRPILRNSKLYVATYDGYIRVLDPASGAELWNKKVSSSNINHNIWVGFLDDSPSSILVTDNSGRLYRIDEEGNEGILVWSVSAGGTSFTTRPVAAPKLEKIYVGTNSGRVHQLDSHTGDLEATALAGDSQVKNLELDKQGSVTDFNRLESRISGKVKYFGIPWTVGDSGVS